MKVNCTNGSAVCELSDNVFATPYSPALVHQTLTSFQSSQRRNVASNKTRSDVKGHAGKPWRQKGTGRSRHGSSKSPLWRGGGLAFASNKPNWQRKINRKSWRACLRVILSQLLREERLLVIEGSYDGEPRTRLLQEWRRQNGAEGSALLIVDGAEPPAGLRLASRNIPDFDACATGQLDPVRLLCFDRVMLTTAAAASLNDSLL